MNRPNANAPFLVAARGQQPTRRPVWIMRQAGRMLPEYREIRAKLSFEELVADDVAAAEVTMQPVRRFDMDAAILFTDLVTPAPAMGVELRYDPGPVLASVVQDARAASALRVPDPRKDLGFMLRAAERVRAELSPDKVLIGFVGAPFTFACYLVEGHGSKQWSIVRQLMRSDPELFRALLTRIVAALEPLIEALVEAGCSAIQVFESWGGVLGPREYGDLCAPFTERLLETVRRSGAIAISYCNCAYQHRAAMKASCADVLGVDWRHGIEEFRAAFGVERPVQGNLDCAALFSPETTLREQVRALCRAAGPVGHIFNLGHGVMPQTDPDSVAVAIDEIRRLDREIPGSATSRGHGDVGEAWTG